MLLLVVVPLVTALRVMLWVSVLQVMPIARVLWVRASGGGDVDDISSRLVVVIVRAL